VDYEFTAELENFLDSISRDEVGREEYLKKFYFGDDSRDKHNVGLHPTLASKLGEIDPKETARFLLGTPDSGPLRDPVYVRVGKFGPYIEQGDRKASIPEGLPPDELDLAKAMELLESGQVEEEPLGIHPESGKPIYVKVGRFGPYIQLGENDDPEKRNQSLLKGMEISGLTVDLACKLLDLPRTLGVYPDNGQVIQAFDGRYGPYIKCDKETRSLPAGLSPLDVTLPQALDLLKQPKTRGRGAPKEPLRVFDEKSPVTGEEIKILDGRFGPYLSDGQTNASLRKGMDPQSMTLPQALDLLAERAAAGPSKKKKASKKKGAAPKPAKTKTAAATKAVKGKKTAVKKAPTKKASSKKVKTDGNSDQSPADD
jgi:DNA topoisomerase-1